MFFASYSAFFPFFITPQKRNVQKTRNSSSRFILFPLPCDMAFLLAYFAFSICASCVFVIDGIAVKQVLQQPDRKKKTALHCTLHYTSCHRNTTWPDSLTLALYIALLFKIASKHSKPPVV